jgi:4-amino-4-deoxy-L-arabinose transferase-like glycosyltransferase
MAMRPDPTERHEHDPSGRIIYLGDVRRRRGSKRQSPDHHYLAAVALAALVGWTVWGVVVFTLSPSKLLTYLAFFIPLAVAVTSTATLVAYGLEHRRTHFASLTTAGRRGVLVGAVVVINLAFLAAHRWTVLLPAITIVAAIAIDLIAVRRA